MGAGRKTYGLAVYDNADDVLDLFELGWIDTDEPERLAVLFNPPSEIDPKELEYIKRSGNCLSPANPPTHNLFKMVFVKQQGLYPVPPDNVDCLLACMQAVTHFARKHRAILERGVQEVIHDTFPVRGTGAIGVSVRFPSTLYDEA